MEQTSFSLDLNNLPAHIGIIMDGNGRWAKQRGMIRTVGHREGLNTAKKIVKTAATLGIKYLSLYAFSTENWKRTQNEVAFLMSLIRIHLKKEHAFYRKNKIRVVHSGRMDDMPRDVLKEIKAVAKDTAPFTGLIVNLAINYGGRDEILRSVNRWLQSKGVKEGDPLQIAEQDIQQNLDQSYFPDPDLIIRTAGEMRISNFLLWQCAYSEFYYSPKLWPDWESQDLEAAILHYQQRIRKFGGTK